MKGGTGVCHRTGLMRAHLVLLLSSGLALACGETPAPTVAIALTPDRIASGGTTRADITVTDFELVAEEHSHLSVAARGHEVEGEPDPSAFPRTGHYHIYLDSFEVNPLVMGTAPSVELTVTASAGPHRVLVRLHGTDHRIIEPQITSEATLTIE